MRAFETITLSLPTHWLPALAYGDTTSLDDRESAAFWRWCEDTVREVGHGFTPHIGTIHDDPYFARWHDAVDYGVLACDCVDVDLMVPAAAPLEIA